MIYIFILILAVAVFVFVKFFLPKMIQQKRIEKPKILTNDQGIEIAILSWFHDHPLCKIPASDIITLYDIIKPFLNKTNDSTTYEDRSKRSIRNVHKEKPQQPRRIIVRAWEDDRDDEVLDNDPDEGKDDNI